jgi:hypothetical protein
VEAARALNLTKSYISMITKAKVGCTATFITRLSAALGSTEGNWWTVFKMVPRGDFPLNHPLYNHLKYDGKMPYEQFSLSSEFRSKDYPVEKHSFSKI